MLQKQHGSGNISARPPAGHPPKMLEDGRDTELLHKALDSSPAAGGRPRLQTWALREAQGRPPTCSRGPDSPRMAPPEPQDQEATSLWACIQEMMLAPGLHQRPCEKAQRPEGRAEEGQSGAGGVGEVSRGPSCCPRPWFGVPGQGRRRRLPHHCLRQLPCSGWPCGKAVEIRIHRQGGWCARPLPQGQASAGGRRGVGAGALTPGNIPPQGQATAGGGRGWARGP